MKRKVCKYVKAVEKKSGMWIKLFPIIFILGVMPLIVHLKFVNTGLETATWFPKQSQIADFFSWWRVKAFCVASVWMVIVLIYRLVVQKRCLKFEKNWVFLGGYLFLVLISTLFSKYKNVSWNGMIENYEGCITLLLYGFSFFYTAQVVENNREKEILLIALAVGAMLQAMLGISQFIGKDFWSSSWGKRLLAPDQALAFRFAGSSENPVYMALYNPDYAAVFIIIMFPVCVYLLSQERKKWRQFLWKMEILLLLFCLWGTGSRTGMVTLIILCGFKFIIKYVHGRSKEIIITVLVIVTGMGVWEIHKKTENVSYRLHEIQIEEEGIEVTTSVGKYVANAKKYGGNRSLLFVKDENGEKLSLKKEKSGRYTIKDKHLRKFSFDTYVKNGDIFLIIYYKKEPFIFVKKDDQEFIYKNIFGKEDTIEKTTTIISTRYDQLFGARVYIWNRIFPLLSNYIFMGSGPDTFAMVFPQNDYIGRVNAAKVMYEQIITRAHNLYLQIALQTGFISLLCFLIFIGGCLNLNLKRKEKMCETIAFCIMGYLIMGLTNDSLIVTAPIFWVLLGINSETGKNVKRQLQ